MLRAVTLNIALGLLAAQSTASCEVALLLAIDVSGSVDAGEFDLQAVGLAEALRDPEVAEILVRSQAALAVVQWSGVGNQELTIPWRRMLSAAEIEAFSRSARAMPRRYTFRGTAVGEALEFSRRQFAPVPDCKRKVIDISSDGAENEGPLVASLRLRTLADGIEINALAIEAFSLSITEFYRRQVISPHGFVITAQGHRDYLRAIRAKLLRELQVPVG